MQSMLMMEKFCGNIQSTNPKLIPHPQLNPGEIFISAFLAFQIAPDYILSSQTEISIGFIPCLFALYLFYKNVYKKINEINEGLLAPIALIVLPISFDHYILTQIQILYAFGMFVVALTAFLYNKN